MLRWLGDSGNGLVGCRPMTRTWKVAVVGHVSRPVGMSRVSIPIADDYRLIELGHGLYRLSRPRGLSLEITAEELSRYKQREMSFDPDWP